jgi:hypothetical protein
VHTVLFTRAEDAVWILRLEWELRRASYSRDMSLAPE